MLLFPYYPSTIHDVNTFTLSITVLQKFEEILKVQSNILQNEGTVTLYVL
jgi:hypothetical protein